MDDRNPDVSPDEAVFAVDNWPMRLDAIRNQLKKAQKLLGQYRAALRLARVEIERRNQSMMTLAAFAYQAGRVAGSTTLLKLALARTLEITGAPVGAVVLIDTDTKELMLGVHKGLTTELTRVLTGQELGAGASVLMPHLVAGSGALLEYASTDDETEKMLLVAGRMTSLVSMPLQAGLQLLGALLVGLQGDRNFKSADLRFIMAISQETATALECLRLRQELWHTAEALLDGKMVKGQLHEIDQAELNLELSPLPDFPTAPTIPQPAGEDLEQLLAAMIEAESEVRQQNVDLQTLNNIAELMNRTLDLEEILTCTVEQTRSILNTDAAWLYLLEDGNRLAMQAQVGLSPGYVRGMRSLKLGKGLEGRVAAQNQACFIEALSDDAHAHKIWVEREGLSALAAVPITRPEPDQKGGEADPQIVGVLVAGRRNGQTYVWSPREIRLLTSIANHVALVIDNARLYAELQRDEAGMRVGNQILREINDSLLQRNVLLEDLVRENLIPAITASARTLRHLQTPDIAPLTDAQIQENAAALQEAVGRLGELFTEAATLNKGLVADGDELPGAGQRTGDKEPEPVSTDKNCEAGSKLLSFKQAVAAGLIPTHMLDRK